ncbi:MAG TPA: M23 family metallopeptidase [Chitinophagaceae bacterium]|nr:M23 family metallopeptidase [Chitinophagaceae bacterium]
MSFFIKQYPWVKLFPLITLFILASCAASKNPLRKQTKLLQKGIIKDDTSYIYALPYENNTSHLLIQGYFSRLSHKERAALDFKMKRGTKICAARDGVVVRAKEDGDKGGWNRKYRPYGNVIVIQHADGTRAGYWHLQYNGALVNVGDTVRKGQLIALSGKTGYTFLPHLHFIVWTFNAKGEWQQVPTHFQTAKGIKYLRPLRRYRKPNQ